MFYVITKRNNVIQCLGAYSMANMAYEKANRIISALPPYTQVQVVNILPTIAH